MPCQHPPSFPCSLPSLNLPGSCGKCWVEASRKAVIWWTAWLACPTLGTNSTYHDLIIVIIIICCCCFCWGVENLVTKTPMALFHKQVDGEHFLSFIHWMICCFSFVEVELLLGVWILTCFQWSWKFSFQSSMWLWIWNLCSWSNCQR